MGNKISFVIFPESGVWVAHGLERNIVTHGESLSEIRDNIIALVNAYNQRLSAADLKRIPKAEQVYWQLYHEAVRANRNLDDFLDAKPEVTESFTMELQTA